MDIVVTEIKQIGREIVLDGNSVIGYQHSANLYIKLIQDTSADNPFAGMVLSAYCRAWDQKMPVSCPIEEKEDGTYILLNKEVFQDDGEVFLSLGGINEDKVVVTSNNLVLQVDESNSIIAGVTPAEEYWQIEVLNAMKAWYASVVDPVFKESDKKLNQLIRRTEEHEEKAEALQTRVEEQQTRLDETLTATETATEAANTAAASANEKASLADGAATKATEAANSASTAADNANTAADSANDIADEVRRKLENGELNGQDGADGKDGKDGKDGELGGDTVPIGAMMPCTTNTVPDGWLLCDGSLVSRTEYSELFAIIGESYGAGDGSTTFALPNEPNPLAHTVTDSAIQFVEREPALYMIIKAKQVVPMAASLTNDTESESEDDAFSAAATKKVVQNYVNQVPQKNQLINGGLQVWQRGTSFTSPLGKYTADRCFHNASVVDSIKVEKVAEGLKMTALKDCVAVIYRYYAKDTDLARFRKQTMTFSYSIDGVIHTFTQGNFGILFIQNDEILEGYTYDGDYEGLGSCILNVQYSMKAGETKVLNWVKLEYGDVATPFIQNSYEQDLFDCSLYCQSLNIKACVAITNANGNSLSIIVPLYTPINEPITLSGLTYPLKIDFRNNGTIKSASITKLSDVTIMGCQAWVDFNLDAVIGALLIGYVVLNKAILLDAEIYS